MSVKQKNVLEKVNAFVLDMVYQKKICSFSQ
jgi:hypothetical protein